MNSTPDHRHTIRTAIVIAVVVILIALIAFALMQPRLTTGASQIPGASASAAVPSNAPSGAPTGTMTPAGETSPFLEVSPDELAAARQALATLEVKAGVSQDGYARDEFGAAWTDTCSVDGCHNHCDTRNDILARDLIDEKVRSDDCTIVSGILHDPYTGKTILFKRGTSTSGAVQIDHIVALGDAWRTGAQDLSRAERTNLANDPRNLVAVDGPTNGAKSDQDASKWLPREAAKCAYVIHQIDVKTTYRLWLTQAEHDAISAILAGC